MSMSSRFAVATHILALLAMRGGPLTSRFIASSVNTNPVVVRRLLGTLSEAQLVTTHLGIDGGALLARAPTSITLLDIYQATEQRTLLSLPSRLPNAACPCGRSVQPVLRRLFGRAETAFEAMLAEVTLLQVVHAIEAQI